MKTQRNKEKTKKIRKATLSAGQIFFQSEETTNNKKTANKNTKKQNEQLNKKGHLVCWADILSE